MPLHSPAKPFCVALYNGIFVSADAISTSVRYKLELVRRLAAGGIPIHATVFAQSTDIADHDVKEMSSVHRLWQSAEFHEADFHLFEFGVYYDLFDAVFLLGDTAIAAGVYHNVTPPSLAETLVMRTVLERSLSQRRHFLRFQRIICDSEFNRDDLETIGVPRADCTIVHLPAAVTPVPRIRPTRVTVRVLFVGRFVAAKGFFDLIRAIERVVQRVPDVVLTLAGNPQLSSSESMAELYRLVDGIGSTTRIVAAPSPDELATLYANSDVMVMPSYHEGFCLPVVEALAAGCHVIAYDSGNLPTIVDGVGTLVPCGNVEALADAISAFALCVQRSRREGAELKIPINGGLLNEQKWREAVIDHLRGYSREIYDQAIAELFCWAASRSGHERAAAGLREFVEASRAPANGAQV